MSLGASTGLGMQSSLRGAASAACRKQLEHGLLGRGRSLAEPVTDKGLRLPASPGHSCIRGRYTDWRNSSQAGGRAQHRTPTCGAHSVSMEGPDSRSAAQDHKADAEQTLKSIAELPGPGTAGMLEWREQLRTAVEQYPLKPQRWPLPLGTLRASDKLKVSWPLTILGNGEFGPELACSWNGCDAVIRAVKLDPDYLENLQLLINEIATYHWLEEHQPQLIGDVVPKMLGYGYTPGVQKYGIITSRVRGTTLQEACTKGADYAELRRKVLGAVDKLHSAGVAHGDLYNFNNIVIGPNRSRSAILLNFADAEISDGSAEENRRLDWACDYEKKSFDHDLKAITTENA